MIVTKFLIHSLPNTSEAEKLFYSKKMYLFSKDFLVYKLIISHNCIAFPNSYFMGKSKTLLLSVIFIWTFASLCQIKFDIDQKPGYH